MNMTEAKTATKYAEDNEKLMAYGVYGRSYTVNPKKWTPASMSALAKYSQSVPGGNAMISIHSLRSPKPNENCVFGAREDHHMIEIVSMTCDSALKDGTAAWGQGLLRELKEKEWRKHPRQRVHLAARFRGCGLEGDLWGTPRDTSFIEEEV